MREPPGQSKRKKKKKKKKKNYTCEQLNENFNAFLSEWIGITQAQEQETHVCRLHNELHGLSNQKTPQYPAEIAE